MRLWDVTGLRRSLMIAAELAANPAAISAWISWPCFSVTSFGMVSGLVKQGVVARTVLDVGANTGQFAVAAAKLFPGPRVYSFEPLPACVTQLRRHASKLPNLTIYPFALGDHEADDLPFHTSIQITSRALRFASRRATEPPSRMRRKLPQQRLRHPLSTAYSNRSTWLRRYC